MALSDRRLGCETIGWQGMTSSPMRLAVDVRPGGHSLVCSQPTCSDLGDTDGDRGAEAVGAPL